MSQSNSKLIKTPVVIHFVGEERARLKHLAAVEQRSVSNLAAKFIRDGMESLERKHEQAQQSA